MPPAGRPEEEEEKEEAKKKEIEKKEKERKRFPQSALHWLESIRTGRASQLGSWFIAALFYIFLLVRFFFIRHLMKRLSERPENFFKKKKEKNFFFSVQHVWIVDAFRRMAQVLFLNAFVLNGIPAKEDQNASA